MTRKIIFFSLIFLIFNMVFALKVLAQSSAEVNVSAVVDSKVSKIQSSVDTNTQETLSDPASHSILLTITLKDADGNPMPNISVVVTSNRGQVDIIEAVSKLGPGKVQAADISDMQKDTTDQNGQVQFRVTSFIPGEAVFTVVADTLVTLNPIKVTFDPPPFPTNVTVGMTNPITGKEITLYSPKQQIDEGLSGAQIAAQKLVNTGTKIQISFWVLAWPTLLILLCPLFIILNFLNLRRMRWMEGEQVKLLQKMFPPNYNRQS
ncbi:MAG: hypothetical protein ABSE91_03035 [Patescibacteria group bacterium]